MYTYIPLISELYTSHIIEVHPTIPIPFFFDQLSQRHPPHPPQKSVAYPMKYPKKTLSFYTLKYQKSQNLEGENFTLIWNLSFIPHHSIHPSILKNENNLKSWGSRKTMGFNTKCCSKFRWFKGISLWQNGKLQIWIVHDNHHEITMKYPYVQEKPP